jgi:hypothetical protein
MFTEPFSSFFIAETMPPSDPIDLTVEVRDLLPEVVKIEWLPDEQKSVLSLFREFIRYPPRPIHYILPANFESVLHQAPIQGFDYGDLLNIPPPALSNISKVYQDEIKKSKFLIHSVTLQPHQGTPITLPAWIFHYWVEIRRVVGIRQQWKIALAWVKEYSTVPQAMDLCHNLLLGLSCFSWSHGAAYNKDITPLLSNSSTESFLNSYHIDHMIRRIEAELQEHLAPDHANRHFFATVDHFNSIRDFYGPKPMKKEGPLWEALMAIENQIVTGKVDTFSGVMHLPLHWVSVLINFQQPQPEILYGDSLGGQMPKHERQACERWMKQIFRRSKSFSHDSKIIHGQLSTGHQTDSFSCGLFALNAISHHHLNTPLLPSDQIVLVCRRMEITLDIISTMTVCAFQSI